MYNRNKEYMALSMNSHMLNSFRCSGRGMAELPRTVVLLLDLVPESMVPLPHVLSAVGSLMAPVGGLEPAGSELLFCLAAPSEHNSPSWLAGSAARAHKPPHHDTRTTLNTDIRMYVLMDSIDL